MPSCPACGRSVALARASCLYCGAALAATAVAAAEPARSPELAAPRVLVLLELAGLEPAALAAALGLSPYEAALLVRRGGLHLVRTLPLAEAESEAERLKERGAVPWLVPEHEVRAAPILCLAGERSGSELRLRTTEGPVRLARGDALLLVQGAITREYQTPLEPRRIATARPEEGYRVQVHRRADPRPLEIDALNFELGFAVSGSARLEVDAWLDAIRGDAPRDSGFARLGPVLGPAVPEPGGALAAAGTLAAASRGGAGERPVVLDNLAQFRLYSGCLAAVHRRRAALRALGA